jgi:competence protein ComEA
MPSKKTDDKIKVYVCGAVRSPDVYTVDADVRMIDAVNAAGGFSADAAVEYLNLAAGLTDGQKIYIPTNREIEEAMEAGEQLYGSEVNITSNSPGIRSGDAQGVQPGNSASGGAGADDKVNINSADRQTLMTLPGIGQSKADKIIAYREANGGFSTIEDIMLVGGIKEGMFNKIKESICVR